jgi:hypothetical protein
MESWIYTPDGKKGGVDVTAGKDRGEAGEKPDLALGERGKPSRR